MMPAIDAITSIILVVTGTAFATHTDFNVSAVLYWIARNGPIQAIVGMKPEYSPANLFLDYVLTKQS